VPQHLIGPHAAASVSTRTSFSGPQTELSILLLSFFSAGKLSPVVLVVTSFVPFL
jgi:hypothetical protein